MAVIPEPQAFTMGERVTAAKLNLNVRDSIGYLINPPRVLAYHGAQSLANNTDPQISLFTSESYDTDGIHSTSVNTSRFTIVTPGSYHIIAQAHYAANATGVRVVYLRRNGNSADRLARNSQAAVSGATMGMQIDTYAYLDVGDYVELCHFQTSGGALLTDATYGGCYVAMRWVGI